MIPNLTILIAAYIVLRCLEISLTPVAVAERYAGRQSAVRVCAVIVILNHYCSNNFYSRCWIVAEISS